MGKGQLVGIPNWFKKKDDWITNVFDEIKRVSDIRTSLTSGTTSETFVSKTFANNDIISNVSNTEWKVLAERDITLSGTITNTYSNKDSDGYLYIYVNNSVVATISHNNASTSVNRTFHVKKDDIIKLKFTATRWYGVYYNDRPASLSVSLSTNNIKVI